MKRSNLILVLASALATLLAGSSFAFAQSDASFGKANQEYSEGKFREAIDHYEAAVHAGQWSAPLFYDLGNAYFRTGDFGRAILNYERALALEPNHPETQANLRIARDEARGLELPQGWPERLLRFANINQYSVAAATAFWLGILFLVIMIFAQRRRRRLIALSVLSFTIFALLVYALVSIESGAKGRSLAIITGSGVQARLATADNAGSVLALPPGSEVRIERERGDWVYAGLPNNLHGWVPARSLEVVRL